MDSKPVKHGSGWRIRWWDANGIRKSQTLHTDYKTARSLLRQKELEVEEIRAGVRGPNQETKIFNQLCAHYLEYYSSHKRNRRIDQSIIDVHLLPFFSGIKLTDINETHFSKYRLEKKHLHPKTIHNHLTLLGSMLRVAVANRWLSECPKIKKPKFILQDKNFRYLRSENEIEIFLRESRSEALGLPFYLYATAIYTGMRAGELSGLKWADIDFERNLITVRHSYEGPTKNGETRHIPILSVLRGPLLEWFDKRSTEAVFPNSDGRPLLRSSRVFQEVLHRVLKRCGFTSSAPLSRSGNYIVFHDLRHTFASHWMMRGGDIFKLQKILGHKSLAMTMRYAHLSPNAFSADFEIFGPALTSNSPQPTRVK